LNFRCLNSWYNISSNLNNDTLKFKATYKDATTGAVSTTITTVTIPDGNYDIITLINYLNSGIPQYDADNNLLTFGSTDTENYPAVSYDTVTSKFIFHQYSALLTQTSPSATNTHLYLSFSLECDSDTIGLLKMLGFINNNDKITTGNSFMLQASVQHGDTSVYTLNASSYFDLDGSNALLISDYIFNLEAITMLNICYSEDVAQNMSSYDDLRYDDRLYSVPISEPFGGTTIYQCDYPSFVHVADPTISSITISIRDQIGNLIDFNGSNWDLQLGFEWGFNDTKPGNDPRNADMVEGMFRGPDGTGIAPLNNVNYDFMTGRSSMATLKRRKTLPK
jgi:hypothetical protein